MKKFTIRIIAVVFTALIVGSISFFTINVVKKDINTKHTPNKQTNTDKISLYIYFNKKLYLENLNYNGSETTILDLFKENSNMISVSNDSGYKLSAFNYDSQSFDVKNTYFSSFGINFKKFNDYSPYITNTENGKEVFTYFSSVNKSQNSLLTNFNNYMMLNYGIANQRIDGSSDIIFLYPLS